ncbi:unnamed protein product [Rhizophagus irregularis]|uniref:HCP-like protein n=1 Tax=Rhizophagus irregularis TaxID=588596 RepID=A0A2I1G7X7_9GLOM|nr:HCP-like protein [Rhizophagus irregularis]CAB4426627.1 unnamed protein product [Rhizophagus irregularis]
MSVFEEQLEYDEYSNFIVHSNWKHYIDTKVSAENGNKISQYNLGRFYQRGNGIGKNEVEAFKWYKKSAKQEYSNSQNKLGYFYEGGIGVEKDLEKAFYWYQKAAENGNKIGQYNLGRFYQYGNIVEKSEVEAFKWYKKSAEKEYTDALNKLGYFYESGMGTKKDLEKAIYWYQKAAKNGNKISQYNLGVCYQYGSGVRKNEVEAFKWYKKSAKQEYSNAQNKLGYFYGSGIGTKKDLEKSFYWYKKAAENGNKISQYNLGRFYQYGIGVEENEVKAFKWYKNSAKQEYSNAQNKLGYFYENGIGTNKDLEKAIYWYLKTAINGHKIGQYNLGRCYQYGNGVRRNEIKALKWYRESAEQEYSNAQHWLGYFYENGIGTEIDLEKAIYWYKKATENENKFSQYNLGLLYENGNGVKKNEVNAFELYKKSAEQEYSNAQHKLGYFYESGMGTEKDLEKAIYWYQKAAENGNKFSQYNLGLCYENGNGVKKDEAEAFELYIKSAEQEYSDALNKLSQSFISKINIPTIRAMVKSINNKQQIIQQLKLNHGLLLGEYSIQPSRQAVFMEDGELNISLCNRQPIVYDLSIDKDNSNNMLQPSDMCINFPIAEITYKGDVSKSFSRCVNNNAILNKLYGHFFASKVLVGSKLFIKNLKSATQTQIDILKFCLLCTYSSAKYSTGISFNNLFTLNLLPKIVTLDGDELNTHEKLAKWMNSLYQEGEKNIFILSYENLIPVSKLKNFITLPRDGLFNENNEKQPGVINFKEKLSLVEWVGDAVDNNLASWTRTFHLFQGLIFKNYEMEISKKLSIDFIKIPKVNPSSKSYLKIIKPSTELEVRLISNDILSLKNLSSFLFTKSNDVMSYEDYCHILIKCEQYEILLDKNNVRPTKEFEHVIEEALSSMTPLKVLQNIFNENGHLFPQRIILGRSLKNILPTSSSSAFETVVSGPESFKLHLDNLNISHFLTPKGKIIKKNKLFNWIQNPNNLEVIEFDDIIPLYKILKETQQKKIDDILQSKYRILMTGVTDLKDLDNNDVDYYKRINIEPSLEDENYEVFGSIISKDNSRLEVIYVNFGSYDINGFFASIKKLEETSVNIKECCILWMVVEKPSELLIFSPSNREFQVERVKESIILRLDKSNYCIKTSFPLSQGYTIFVHAYYPSNNYEPNNTIKLVKWSYNYVTFQIIKSTYGKSNNNFSKSIRESIKLDLHICVLCSDYRSLKIDNKEDYEYSLDLSRYILTKDNFDDGNQ